MTQARLLEKGEGIRVCLPDNHSSKDTPLTYCVQLLWFICSPLLFVRVALRPLLSPLVSQTDTHISKVCCSHTHAQTYTLGALWFTSSFSLPVTQPFLPRALRRITLTGMRLCVTSQVQKEGEDKPTKHTVRSTPTGAHTYTHTHNTKRRHDSVIHVCTNTEKAAAIRHARMVLRDNKQTPATPPALLY